LMKNNSKRILMVKNFLWESKNKLLPKQILSKNERKQK
jgi:hypothetical protein